MAIEAARGAAVPVETGDNIAGQLRKQVRLGEMIIEGLLFVSGAISILVTIGIVLGKSHVSFRVNSSAGRR